MLAKVAMYRQKKNKMIYENKTVASQTRGSFTWRRRLLDVPGLLFRKLQNACKPFIQSYKKTKTVLQRNMYEFIQLSIYFLYI